MKRASVTDAKNRLRALIDHVRQGILRPPISTASGTFLDMAPPKSKRRVSLSGLVIDERRHSR